MRDECEHGNLRRKCEACSLKEDIADLEAKLAASEQAYQVAQDGLNYANELLSQKTEQLAASQLCEKQRREALEDALLYPGDPYVISRINEALAISADDAALREHVARELEKFDLVGQIDKFGGYFGKQLPVGTNLYSNEIRSGK